MIDLLGSLTDMFGDEVVIATADGRDLFGTNSHGADATYTVHIQRRRREFRTADGKTVVEQGRVWFQQVIDVSVEDRIRLPDGSEPLVVDVQTHHDEDGAEFTVVGFG